MSVRTRLARLGTCAALGLALVATSCSAAPTIVSGDVELATSDGTSENAATAELDAALGDLSEEEAELFLQAFEEAFNGDGTAAATVEDPYAPASTVPANGGAPDHTAIPYGLCSDGWFVFDTLTWSDAYSMLGHTGYNGGVAQDQYEYDGYDLDAGATFIKDEIFCPIGDTDQTGNLSMSMSPYSTAPNREYWTDERITSEFQGDLRYTQTQSGQPMVVKIEATDGQTTLVEVFLEWDWADSSDGTATLQLGYSNYYDDGVRDDQITALIAIAEMVSANVDFTPPAFTSPLPSWYTCEGRNFVNADVNEVAKLIGFDGQAVALHGIERDWGKAECAFATVEPDGDFDWAVGEYGVAASVYAPNSDDYGYDIDSILQDAVTVQGTVDIGGRTFATFANPDQSGVILDNGSGPVVISVFALSAANGADDMLAKAIEVVQVITR